jgi:hypothetical protein
MEQPEKRKQSKSRQLSRWRKLSKGSQLPRRLELLWIGKLQRAKCIGGGKVSMEMVEEVVSV